MAWSEHDEGPTALVRARDGADRAIDLLGDRWCLLILRQAEQGVERYNDFRANLDVASNILSERLKFLVGAGLLERRLYSARPPRCGYLLTVSGRAFTGVFDVLEAWASVHLPGARADLDHGDRAPT
uniref:Transcriptional regulator, HxlR family n=1 Tax=Caulobacter sp. (strain K31) TaxID=366602 RepID=B0T946_CAUSK